MAVFEQGEHGLKHIALLRKVITERRTGIGSFKGSDWSINIPFDHGVFLIEENAAETLCRIIVQPVLHFEWVDSTQQVDDMAIPIMPRLAFSQTMSLLDLPEDRLNLYKQMFSKLPAVRIRITSIFRFDLTFQQLFQNLYSMSLAAEGAQLSEYFDAAIASESLSKRINIVIALYCLGDLLPIAKKDEAVQEASRLPSASVMATDKANVVSRILMRLRGA